MCRKLGKWLIAAIALVFIVVVAAFGMGFYLFLGHPFRAAETVYVYVDRDDNVDSLRQKICRVAQPSQMQGFHWLARYDHLATHIHTGMYAIHPADNWRYVVRRLAKGYQTPTKVHVNSVRTLGRMARQLAAQLMIDSTEIVTLFADTAFVHSLGYDAYTLPALFIPNTYELYWDITPQALLKRLQREHEAFWTEARKQKAAAIGLNDVEVATLASIVEEETANEAEKGIVAGLYLNRLQKGMLLQADPTVKFAVGDFMLRRILNKHLEVDSPYNTYKNPGLPPGPIRIPSVQGLNSVLDYKRHDYLYMCAKEDFSGTHNFAETLAQHALNARRYQQALNARGIR